MSAVAHHRSNGGTSVSCRSGESDENFSSSSSSRPKNPAIMKNRLIRKMCVTPKLVSSAPDGSDGTKLAAAGQYPV